MKKNQSPVAPVAPRPVIRRPDGTAVAVAPVAPAPVAVAPAPVAPVGDGPAPVGMAPALTVADVIPGFAAPVPVHVAPMVAGFRAMVGMPDNGSREHRAAMVAAFIDAANAVTVAPIPPDNRRHGRWSGLPVAESQNVLYFAAILANVAVTESHVMAAWRAELPGAKCDFLAKNYAWSTLSQFIGNRHGMVPGIPGAYDAIVAWNKRGRKPA